MTNLELVAWGAGAFVLAVLGTGWVLRRAQRAGILDVPNERSSHTVPTPRGGGLAIVAVASAGALAMAWQGADRGLLTGWLGGGIAVAAIGWMDDRRSVRASLRLLVHLIAAAWAVYWIGGLPPLLVGSQMYDLGLAGDVLAVLGIVWALNLFNFMDGIDGIAASESAFVCLAAAALMAWNGIAGAEQGILVALGAASLGFLKWNWPRARIFMGDVGSGFLGFAIATLAFAYARHEPVAPLVWLILFGSFVADSSVTLLSRLFRGVPVYQAHRTHAYQRLADRWGGHRPVTVAYIVVNFVWLLPCAFFALSYPPMAPILVVLALTPLAVGAIALRAGRTG
jgi:Fuc2NAc and GlcNAc transferase